MSKETKTEPISPDQTRDSRVHLSVAATWQDPITKALYVHQDLLEVQKPWAQEEHVGPMVATEDFGDVASFVSYVMRYGDPPTAHLTWNGRGLRAILDYAHDGRDLAPGAAGERIAGRGQWKAFLPFSPSIAWRAWTAFATNQPLGQKAAVEKLEDLAGDIVEPSPADLMHLLRGLRASVNARADAELRPDGTTKVAFERDSQVKSASALELPSSFAIAIPVLKGHLGDDGRPVVYRLDVRLRVSVDDAAKLTLRFAMPQAERVLESVYADRVATAEALLGESFALLRAAD